MKIFSLTDSSLLPQYSAIMQNEENIFPFFLCDAFMLKITAHFFLAFDNSSECFLCSRFYMSSLWWNIFYIFLWSSFFYSLQIHKHSLSDVLHDTQHMIAEWNFVIDSFFLLFQDNEISKLNFSYVCWNFNVFYLN